MQTYPSIAFYIYSLSIVSKRIRIDRIPATHQHYELPYIQSTSSLQLLEPDTIDTLWQPLTHKMTTAVETPIDRGCLPPCYNAQPDAVPAAHREHQTNMSTSYMLMTRFILSGLALQDPFHCSLLLHNTV